MQNEQTSAGSAGTWTYRVHLELRRALVELDRGRTTLNDYVAKVWIPIYAPVLAPSNLATHRYLYANHLGPRLGSCPLRELTTEALSAWQAEQLQTGGDPRTLRRALLVLSSILRTAVQAHYLERNPARLLLEPVTAA